MAHAGQRCARKQVHETKVIKPKPFSFDLREGALIAAIQRT
jgi:hypothetical protein